MSPRIHVVRLRDENRPMPQPDIDALHAALTPLVLAMARMSDRLRVRLIASIVATYVMNHPDAVEAFETVLDASQTAILRAVQHDLEAGGTA